eukprot:scaffold80893_cov41-Attheya_sp.AAC.1
MSTPPSSDGRTMIYRKTYGASLITRQTRTRVHDIWAPLLRHSGGTRKAAISDRRKRVVNTCK